MSLKGSIIQAALDNYAGYVSAVSPATTVIYSTFVSTVSVAAVHALVNALTNIPS